MIELRQLVGKRRSGDGVIREIAHPVDEVLRDGVRIGYLARHTGAALIFLPQCPRVEHQDVRNAVAKLREEAGEYGPPSERTHAAPTSIPIDTQPDDDEDDDDDNE